MEHDAVNPDAESQYASPPPFHLGVAGMIPTARVGQAHSYRARSASKLPFTARIERAQFHRARSASKKDGWLFPIPSLLKDQPRLRHISHRDRHQLPPA